MTVFDLLLYVNVVAKKKMRRCYIELPNTGDSLFRLGFRIGIVLRVGDNNLAGLSEGHPRSH